MELKAVSIKKNNLQYFKSLLLPNAERSFSEGKVCGIGAVADKKAAGILLYCHDGFFVTIKYIAVCDALRRKGIGTFLVDTLCRAADSKSMGVTADFFSEGEPSEDDRYLFFSSLTGFSVNQEECAAYDISMEELKKVFGKVEAGKKNALCIRKFYDLTDREKKEFFRKTGIDPEIAGVNKNALKELCIYIGNPADPEAAAFVRKGMDGSESTPVLSYVWGCKKNSMALLSLLKGFYGLLENRKPEVSSISFATVNPEADHLAKHMFPDAPKTGTGISVTWDMDIFPLPVKE